MIRLRLPELRDAEPLTEAVHESLETLEPWMEFASPAYSAAGARTWIVAQESLRTQRSAFEFVIVDEDDRVLGACGVNRIAAPPLRVANVGYWVRDAAAGRGVAPEACRQLLAWAEANTEVERFEIVVAVGNLRSRRVAEKVGGQYEGTLRRRLWCHGVAQDAWMFSVLRSRARSV